MKNLRMILSSAIVLVAVGSAFAFKAKLNPDIRICDNNNICQEQFDYSTQVSSVIGHPTFIPYQGAIGSSCAPGGPCKRYNQTVYVNQ
jgi:hypothetical protein